MHIRQHQKFVTASDDSGNAVTFTCLNNEEGKVLAAKLDRVTSCSFSINKQKYTIGDNSTDLQKYIYTPDGDLAAVICAPDASAEGVKFAREHAERILNALNAG